MPMESRKQFTFYSSIFESASRIKNKAARCDFYDAICKYALTGESPDLDKLPDAVAVGFISVKPNLDASRKKANSGKAGGKAKQTASKPQANGKQSASEKEIEKEIEKELEIENECYISSTATAAEDIAAAAAEAEFDLFWEKYPNQIGCSDANAAWESLRSSGVAPAQIMVGLDRWLSSAEWGKENGRFIPRPAKWLEENRWKENPVGRIPQGATGSLGNAELEAIRRMFAEDEK